MAASYEQVVAALKRGGYDPDKSGGDADRIARGWVAAESGDGGKVRGVLLTGAYGCGKTLAARALRRGGLVQCALPEAVEWLDSLDGRDICDGGNWTLDDLGREADTNRYGVRRNLVAEFLEAQYRDFCAARWRTPPIITTNLAGEGIVKRYDAHLMSRLAEAFVWVKCAAPDHRTARLTVIE